MNLRSTHFVPVFAVLAGWLSLTPAEAATETWLGGTSSWSAPGNWAGANSTPQNGDSLVFGAAGAGGVNLTNDLTNSSFSIAGVAFTAGAAAFVIGDGTAAHANAGNAFQLAGNILDESASVETFQDPFSVTAGQTVSVGPANGVLILSGSISGNAGITVAGSGSVKLTGLETFTGPIDVNSGTLIVSGASTGAPAVVSGGTLELDYSGGSTGNLLDPSKPLTIGGNAAILTVNGGATSQTQTFASLALQAGSSTISLTNNGAGTGLVLTSGVIARLTGATLNVLAPSGTAATLSGNNSNPLLGPWAFFNGSNYAATNASGGVQAAALTAETTPGLNGLTSPLGNYAYTSPGTPDVQTIPAATANTVTFSTAGPQTLDLGSNTLTLNGFINNGALLTIQRTGGLGTLRAGSTNELVIGGTGSVLISVPIGDNPGNSSALTVSNTGTVISTGANNFTGGTNINAGTLQIGNGTSNGTFGLGSYTIAGGATLKLSYASVGTAPLWGNIGGAGTLELSVALESDWAGGPGQQYIALTPAFTGTLQIDSGRVPANGAAALAGTTAIVIANGGQFATFNGGTFSQNLTLAGTGWGETGYESAIRMANGTLTGTYTGSVALSASATVAATGVGIFSGAISGPAAATLTTGTNKRPADGNGQEGTVIFAGNNTYSGATVVKAGTLQVSGSTGVNLGSTAYTVNGTLILNNLTSAGGNSNNRINDSAGVSLIGGTLLDLGADAAATSSTETLGILSGTGSSTITVSFGGTNAATLSAAAWTHAQGTGSVLVNGSALGRDGTTTASVARVFVTSAPALSAGSAALSSGINSLGQNTQIVPFLVGESVISSGGLGTATGFADTFLTYNNSTGFRPLNPTDEFTQNAFVSGNNTRITSAATASAGGAINSLVMAGGTLTISDGKTVTVSSGALLFASANAINPSSSTGALAFGSAEGMVTVDAGLTATIAVPVSGSNGLTKGGRGTLVLSGTNAITGGVNVSGGILQVTTSSAIPATVTVNGNGTFDLNGQSLQSPVAISVTVSGTGTPGTPGALTNSSSGEGSIANLTLAGDAQIGSSNNKLNLYGSSVNLAGHTLTVAGAGTTDIRTDNSLQGTGTVQVVQGSLRFESSQAGTGFTFNVGAFGTLDTFNTRTLSENVTLNSGTLGNGFGASTWSGAFTLIGTPTVNDHGNQIALTGSVGGSGSLSKTGTGTVTLSGNNTYTGGTTISAGTLAVTQASAGATPLGLGPVTLAGGVLSVRGAQAQPAATGWNADVIHDAAENTANFGTNSTVDGVGYIFYGSGSAGAPQKGLPGQRGGRESGQRRALPTPAVHGE